MSRRTPARRFGESTTTGGSNSDATIDAQFAGPVAEAAKAVATDGARNATAPRGLYCIGRRIDRSAAQTEADLECLDLVWESPAVGDHHDAVPRLGAQTK